MIITIQIINSWYLCDSLVRKHGCPLFCGRKQPVGLHLPGPCPPLSNLELELCTTVQSQQLYSHHCCTVYSPNHFEIFCSSCSFFLFLFLWFICMLLKNWTLPFKLQRNCFVCQWIMSGSQSVSKSVRISQILTLIIDLIQIINRIE